MPLWEQEIRDLAADFRLDKRKVKAICDQIKNRYPKITDDEYLYDRAWSKIRPLLMAI